MCFFSRVGSIIVEWGICREWYNTCSIQDAIKCKVWWLLSRCHLSIFIGVIYCFLSLWKSYFICQFKLVIFQISDTRYWRISYYIYKSYVPLCWTSFSGKTDNYYKHLCSTSVILFHSFVCVWCVFTYIYLIHCDACSDQPVYVIANSTCYPDY